MTTIDQLISAIHGQESNYGKADTSQANYAGARGPMQVTESTFRGLKTRGLIPTSYEHSNPEHTMAAGKALIADLYAKFDGDPRKVAAAYYSGEGVVRPDGSIGNYRDKVNPNAPTTHQYADQVLSRLGAGQSGTQGTPVTTPPALSGGLASPELRPSSNMDTPYPADYVKSSALGTADTASEFKQPYVPSIGIPATGDLNLRELQADRAAALSTEQLYKDTSFLDKTRAAFIQTDLAGSVIRSLSKIERNSGTPPVPGYTVPAESLSGMTAAEQDMLRESTSPLMTERTRSIIEADREQQAIMMRSGTGIGLAAGLVAGLPTGYATGIGAAKAFTMLGVARGATTGTQLARVLGENVAGNVAVVAAQAAIDPYVSLHHVPLAVAMAGVGTVLHGAAMLSRGGSRVSLGPEDARAVQGFDDMRTSAAASSLQDQIRAVQALGEDAPPAALAEHALQTEIARVEAGVQLARADVQTPSVMPETSLAHQSLRENPVVPGRPLPAGFPGEDAPTTAAVDAAYRSPSGEAKLGQLEGSSMAEADTLPAGVTVKPKLAATPGYAPVTMAVEDIANRFLPAGTKIIAAELKAPGALGRMHSIGDTHFIGLNTKLAPEKALNTAMHEMGHAVFHTYARDIPEATLVSMLKDFESFRTRAWAGEAGTGFTRFHEGSNSASSRPLSITGKRGEYNLNFDEFVAEGFVKHLQARVSTGEAVFSPTAITLFQKALEQVKKVWDYARGKGWVSKQEGLDGFFLWAEKQREVKASEAPTTGAVDISGSDSRGGVPTNPTQAAEHAAYSAALEAQARTFGIDHPTTTIAQLAELQNIVDVHVRAHAEAPVIDEARLSKLLDTAVFKGAQSDANTLLRSENPVLRWASSVLLENPSGAAGRQKTAAMTKHILHGELSARSSLEYEGAYIEYRKGAGGGYVEDTFKGEVRARFNRAVYAEIEARKAGATQPPDSTSYPSVVRAADALEAGFERARLAQVGAQVTGFDALPTTSVGYIPHRLSFEKLASLNPEQKSALIGVLSDQYHTRVGYDAGFAKELATKYVNLIINKGLGGFDAPLGGRSMASEHYVKQTMQAMGLSEQEIAAKLRLLRSPGAAHLQQRADFDLFASVETPSGNFKLIDLMEDDPLALLTRHLDSVAGEVALTKHGIQGARGLEAIRAAAEFPGSSQAGRPATPEAMERFDAISAELTGVPVGKSSQLLSNVMSANALVRLGGMGWSQLGETFNGLWHVGASHMLQGVPAIPRLISELRALGRGELVNNPILSSIEHEGAEFGAANAQLSLPFAQARIDVGAYGTESVTTMSKLLRGGLNIQAKLSMWSAIHSVQNRWFSELVVKKMLRAARLGKSDVALRDMGFTDKVLSDLRNELNVAAKFDDAGNPTAFDVTKIQDQDLAQSLVQAVHRATRQIIQEPLIGEGNAWRRDPVMRAVTQFKTFGVMAIEKQWGRQVGNVGTAKALGMLVGSMALVAPLYAARSYVNSIGRADQDDYLAKRLTAANIAQGSLNYISMSGLSGELINSVSTITGYGAGDTSRVNVGKPFVGSQVLPAAGLINDAVSAFSVENNGKGRLDYSKALGILPGNRLPFLVPAVNALKPEQ